MTASNEDLEFVAECVRTQKVDDLANYIEEKYAGIKKELTSLQGLYSLYEGLAKMAGADVAIAPWGQVTEKKAYKTRGPTKKHSAASRQEASQESYEDSGVYDENISGDEEAELIVSITNLLTDSRESKLPVSVLVQKLGVSAEKLRELIGKNQSLMIKYNQVTFA